MASIQRRETGSGPRWRVIWRNPGDPRQVVVVCHSADAARHAKVQAESAHDRGLAYYGPVAAAEEAARVEAERRAVEDLRAREDLRFLATEYLRARGRKLAPGSIGQIDTALGVFLSYLEPDPETRIPLERLTVEAIGGHYDYLRAERKCSTATATARVGFVLRWWRWCYEQERWLDLRRPRDVELPEVTPHPEPVAPTWEEMDRAVACAAGWYARLMTVCRYTGLRGEDQVLQLRRDDLIGDDLRIRPELGKTRPERRGRLIPVSRHLAAAIDAWPEDPDGWLVHVERTTARHAGTPKRRAWNDQTSGAWERAGVRPEVWDTQPTADGSRRNGHPLHAFRRGVITGLLALGADLPDVQYLVGHQLAGGVTTDRYTDPTIARKLRATVDLIPPIRDVETRAIQGGVVVWLDAVTEGRWRSTR